LPIGIISRIFDPKQHFSVDRSGFLHYHSPGRIITRQPFFFAALAFLLLSACGSGSSTPVARPIIIYPSAPPLVASAEQRPPATALATGAQSATPPQDNGETQKAEPQKTPQKQPYTKTSDNILAKRSLREQGAGAPSPDEDMSLFLRQDGANDDNIASLLTDDYLKQFDIPIVFNDAVQYFVKYFTTQKRKIFANWLRRSKRYVPMIKEILRSHGLPEDLIYLAMIESGFNPQAYSSMKACGPWQFIYETGGRYGLRVNHWVDERRDPEKSTVAAALYLKDLFNQFGGWYLAAAAYNAGEKRIERSVEKYETADFWELMRYNTLPRETREYIPRLLAAAIIAKDPERFGFTDIDYDQPVRFVSEKAPGGTPLEVIAKAASTNVSVIRALNPEILTGITPPDEDDYTLKLPEWVERENFREELTIALQTEKKVRDAKAHTMKRRESLAAVMKRYDVGYKDLRLVNACDQELRAQPGAVVYIPTFCGRPEKTEVGQEKRPEESNPPAKAESAPLAQEPVRVALAATAETGKHHRSLRQKASAPSRTETGAGFHIVKKGECLAGISGQYRVSMATLRTLNNLKRDRIHPNMRLRLTSRQAGKEKPARPAIYRVVKKRPVRMVSMGGHSVKGRTLKALQAKKHVAKRSASASQKLKAS
jgi:membrane-bound lytic murein transglycosylase D